MTWKPPTQQEVEAFLATMGGRRGHEIPADVFDRIHPVASSITKQHWGSPPTPHQLQYLHDNGLHQPEQIHAAFGGLPHPHAPSVTVDEYQRYAAARQLFQKHQGPPNAR